MAGAVAAYLLLPTIFGNAIDKIYDIFKEGGSGSLPEGEILVIVLVILGLSIIRGVLSLWQTRRGEDLYQYVAYD